MKRVRKGPSFKELEAEWYERLAQSGFKDIESVKDPERPLKQFHSQKFSTEKSRARQVRRTEYNKRIDDFINSRDLSQICKSISQHGNSSVTPAAVKKILELHREGETERAIARKLKRGKKCVHLTLAKAREWMKVA